MKKNQSPERLAGLKILITGASGGIGSSIADKFLKNESEMILTSSSDTTLSKLRQKYGNSNHYYVLDFKNPEQNNTILKKNIRGASRFKYNR